MVGAETAKKARSTDGADESREKNQSPFTAGAAALATLSAGVGFTFRR
jgi:hypothetical protein